MPNSKKRTNKVFKMTDPLNIFCWQDNPHRVGRWDSVCLLDVRKLEIAQDLELEEKNSESLDLLCQNTD